jgi:hypothetical protein
MSAAAAGVVRTTEEQRCYLEKSNAEMKAPAPLSALTAAYN